MKIAFDVHGTIKENPEIFKPFMKTLVESGSEVCIISGPPTKDIYDELEKLGYQVGIHFEWVYSVVDYLQDCTNVKMTQDEKGHWWCSEEEWWHSKSMICREFDIDIIIDNDLRYEKTMPSFTKFIHWNTKMEETL